MAPENPTQLVPGPDGNQYPVCAICSECVYHKNPALDNDSLSDQDKLTAPEYLLDDVVLNKCPAGHHFHWECITTHKGDVDYCPGCVAGRQPGSSNSSSSPLQQGPGVGYVANDIGQVLAAVTTSEGGTEPDFNIKSAILYEQTLDTPYLLNDILDEFGEFDETEHADSNARMLRYRSVAEKYPLPVLSQCLFSACALGDMNGVLQLTTLMPGPEDIYALVSSPIVSGASSSSAGGAESFYDTDLVARRHSMIGWTPIFEAVDNGRGYIVNALLAAGANPHTNAIDTETGISRNAAEYAHFKNRPDIAVFIECLM